MVLLGQGHGNDVYATVSTKHSTNVVLMLGQDRTLWTGIGITLSSAEYLVFTGLSQQIRGGGKLWHDSDPILG